LSFPQQYKDKKRWWQQCCHLFHSKKKIEKIKMEEKGGSLPSSSSFYHWVEVPSSLFPCS
jgi:hypothetical protein